MAKEKVPEQESKRDFHFATAIQELDDDGDDAAVAAVAIVVVVVVEKY